MLGKLAAAVVDQALRIDEPDPLAGLFLAQALQLEEARELHANTDASGTCAEE